MKIDFATLIVVHGVIGLLQVIIFAHQYRTMKRYNGIDSWLLWSVFQMVSFVFMFIRLAYPGSLLLIIIQNFFLFTGAILIYAGINRFFNKKGNLLFVTSLNAVALVIISYFVVINNDLNTRAAAVSIILAVIGFLSAFALYTNRTPSLSKSINFSIFFLSLHVIIMLYRSYLIFTSQPLQNITDSSFVNLLVYIDGMMVSLLLTFGLVSMVNQRLNFELTNANEVKDKLYRIIAHDLRGPFNLLINYSEILSDDSYDLTPEGKKKYCLALNTAAKSQYHLLTDLLNWTRLQTNVFQHSPENINLYLFVKLYLSEIEWIAHQKKIKLQNCVPFNIKIFADSEMLKLVIRNLITNAIKFSQEEGIVKISAEEKSGSVHISIEDYGIGMQQSEIDKLLSADMPLSKQGTASEKGTGIGFMLCKEIIEKLEGTISITSEPGKGSTFTFTVPASVSKLNP